ncbi:thioesterase II family protein [Streptomyces sp. NPDC056508]|uniref:thioesterase II family protein n=1 Tax=Streptomyces sp. NPDC056508 TaxID=3345845 RepID=UPI0036CC85B5
MSESPGAGSWFRRFRPAPQAPVRLVCLPHGGGSAGFFLPVAHALAPAVDVLAVQYPGRQDRRGEEPVADLQELADRITEALAPYRDRPLAFFGHSMGATLGFEVARRLEAAGEVPAVLFASGRPAPSIPFEGGLGAAGDERLLAELDALGGTDAALLRDPELLAMVLPALRADYRAVETYAYRPGPALTCPVVALTGDRDPVADVEGVLAWEEHTTGPFTAEVFPGGHFFLTDRAEEVLATVVAHLGPAPRIMAGQALGPGPRPGTRRTAFTRPSTARPPAATPPPAAATPPPRTA